MVISNEELISISQNAERGNVPQAFQDCEEIVKKNPGNSEALHLSGYLAILLGDPETAIQRLLEAITEQPNNVNYLSTLGNAYKTADNLREMCACYRRILNIQPENMSALVNLISVNASKGQLANVHECLRRAKNLEPNNTEVAEIEKICNKNIQKSFIAPLDAALPDALNSGKPIVIYPLSVVGRMGHLIMEPFLLKCLFDPDEYDIYVITPERKLSVSPPVYDIALRDTFPIQVPMDEPVLGLWGHRSGTYKVNNRTYVVDSIVNMFGRVLRNLEGTEYPHQFRLSEEEQEQGLKLRQNMGIPADAPIITLYVREKGFIPERTYHNLRNADIENYLPAIKYLVDEGYFVVRIGDDKMQPLPDLGPQVIDTPFHPAYSQLVEPYFVSQSEFMIKTNSGPDVFTSVFGVPSLWTNTYWHLQLMTNKDDLIIPKKYFSHRYMRYLSMADIASNRELLLAWHTSEYTARHIELVENSSSEILAATEEMLSRVRGNFKGNDTYDKIFRSHCVQIHSDSEKDIYNDISSSSGCNYFAPYFRGLKISHSFCETNPDFLG